MLQTIIDEIKRLKQRISDLETQEIESGSGSVIDQFTELTDTPDDYTGQAGKVTLVKQDETGLEFGNIDFSEGVLYNNNNQFTLAIGKYFHVCRLTQFVNASIQIAIDSPGYAPSINLNIMHVFAEPQYELGVSGYQGAASPQFGKFIITGDGYSDPIDVYFRVDNLDTNNPGCQADITATVAISRDAGEFILYNEIVDNYINNPIIDIDITSVDFRHTNVAPPGDMMKSVYDTDGNGVVDDSDASIAHRARTDNPHSVSLEQARTVDNVIQGDIDFNSFEAIAMVCDKGEVPPDNPAGGQWFLHVRSNRQFLMMYDGTRWKSFMSFIPAHLYVDADYGADDPMHGHAPMSDAFKTIQYAIDTVPGSYIGDITIHIRGSFIEQVVIGGKKPMGNYNLILEGYIPDLYTFTVQQISPDPDCWDANTCPHEKMVIWTNETFTGNFGFWSYINPANDKHLFIRKSDSSDNRIELIGWDSDLHIGDTFKVSNVQNTTIDWQSGNPDEYTMTLENAQTNVIFRNVNIKGSSNYFVYLKPLSQLKMEHCKIEPTPYFSSQLRIMALVTASLSLDRCMFWGHDDWVIYAQRGSVVICNTTGFYNGLANKTRPAILCQANSVFDMLYGSVIHGFHTGVSNERNSASQHWSKTQDNFIEECEIGLIASTGSMNLGAGHTQFVNCTTNVQSTPASYGYASEGY